MCNYCTENENKHEEISSVHMGEVGLDLINDRLYITTMTEGMTYCETCGPEYEEFYYDGIKINYCPMCGEKLV